MVKTAESKYEIRNEAGEKMKVVREAQLKQTVCVSAKGLEKLGG